jgi:hypothetical protein
MKKVNTNTSDYNKVVEQAYYRILRYAFSLISKLEDEPFKQALVRLVQPLPTGGLLHEWINPLIFLRLGCISNEYVIHFGFEEAEEDEVVAAVTSAFMRYIYTVTSKTRTAINIERAVRTDWMISNPAEMFDYVLDHSEHHTVVLIKPKLKPRKRKRMLSVA